MTPEEFESMVEGYVETAIWADMPEPENEREAKRYGNAVVSRNAWEGARKDCKAFLEAAGDLITDEDNLYNVGHNLWLTRQHHGAGFWDGDYLPKERGDALTKIAHDMGECYLEIHRGRIYF